MKKSALLSGLALLLIALAGANASAQVAKIESTGMFGSGCPYGTSSATISPDGSAISILFDSFSLSADAKKKVTRTGMDCMISLMVRPPAGYRLKVMNLNYHGFVSMDHPRAGVEIATNGLTILGASGTYQNSTTQRTLISGVRDKEFSFTQAMPKPVKASCDDYVAIQFRTIVTLIAGIGGRIPMYANVSATLDSTDIGGDAGVEFAIGLERCN